MGKKSGAAAPVDFKGQEGCLTIQVKNAAKLPNRDLLGESDPFVELELDGESIFLYFLFYTRFAVATNVCCFLDSTSRNNFRAIRSSCKY